MAALPEGIAHPERLDALRADCGDMAALAAECAARASWLGVSGEGRDDLREALSRLPEQLLFEADDRIACWAMHGYAALLPEPEALAALHALSGLASGWTEPKSGGTPGSDALARRSLATLLDYESYWSDEEWNRVASERKRARDAIAALAALDMTGLGEAGLSDAIRVLCWALAFARMAPAQTRESWWQALMAALDELEKRVG
jgi:hypothetical protein